MLKSQYDQVRNEIEQKCNYVQVSASFRKYHESCNKFRDEFTCIKEFEDNLKKALYEMRLIMRNELQSYFMQFDQDKLMNLIEGYNSMIWRKEYEEDFQWAVQQSLYLTCEITARTFAEQYLKSCNHDVSILDE
jgi:hypothetical protein